METELTLQIANGISKESWLNDENYAKFVAGYEYAMTQTRAIPALSKCSPEEMYFAWSLINRGKKLNFIEKLKKSK